MVWTGWAARAPANAPGWKLPRPGRPPEPATPATAMRSPYGGFSSITPGCSQGGRRCRASPPRNCTACGHAGALGVALGKVHHAVRHIAAEDRRVGRAPRLGLVLSSPPRHGAGRAAISRRQSAAASRPRCRRRSAPPRWRWCRCRSRGRTAARRRRERIPAAGGDHGGGQGFLQRRLALVLAPAALEQRLARGVDVQRGGVGGQVGIDAHVGPLGVRRRGARRFSGGSGRHTASLILSAAKFRLRSAGCAARDLDLEGLLRGVNQISQATARWRRVQVVLVR
jgi:hypothetical protein